MGLRYWAAARCERGDAAGTRVLAKVLPAHRTLPAAAAPSIQWLPDVVRLALTAGEPAVAVAAAKVCAQEADSQARPATKAAAQHCQGLLDADPGAVRAAAGLFQAVGYPLFSAPGPQPMSQGITRHAELRR